jgi:transcription initiation factor TFIID subunit 5
VRVFAGHAAAVACLAFCPSGRYLASGSEDGTVRVWDVASGAEVALLVGHQGPVHSVDFSAEGAVVATGGADGTVRLFDVASALVAGTSKALATCGRVDACATFHTKSTPVAHVRWTHQNLLLAGGAFEVRP